MFGLVFMRGKSLQRIDVVNPALHLAHLIPIRVSYLTRPRKYPKTVTGRHINQGFFSVPVSCVTKYVNYGRVHPQSPPYRDGGQGAR